MKRIFKKGVILIGISAMIIGIVGCTDKKTTNNDNNEVVGTTVESSGELPIATIVVKDFGTIKVQIQLIILYLYLIQVFMMD